MRQISEESLLTSSSSLILTTTEQEEGGQPLASEEDESSSGVRSLPRGFTSPRKVSSSNKAPKPAHAQVYSHRTCIKHSNSSWCRRFISWCWIKKKNYNFRLFINGKNPNVKFKTLSSAALHTKAVNRKSFESPVTTFSAGERVGSSGFWEDWGPADPDWTGSSVPDSLLVVWLYLEGSRALKPRPLKQRYTRPTTTPESFKRQSREAETHS